MPKRRSQTTSFDATLESTTIRHRDTICRSCSSSDHEDRIPIPIQIFLWRQSNPFIKQKFGNLTDASAIVFDQILVQNILNGLSPSLTNAISSIPRWLLIKAAFPHIIHACLSIIEHNLHSIQQPFPHTHPSFLITASPSTSIQLQVPILPVSLNPTTMSNQLLFHSSSLTINNHSLNPIEIRLFHILHYLILYSNDKTDKFLSLNTIQLFIYLFIPYIHTYLRNKEKDFLLNSDLNQGMRVIWQPLFEYHQPNIRIFNSFVKSILLSNDQQEERFPIENNTNDNQHHPLSIFIESPTPKSIDDKQSLPALTNIKFKKELESSTFILTDSDSTTTTPPHDSITDLEDYEITNNTNSTKIRAPLVHMNSICSMSDLTRLTTLPQNPVADKVNVIPGRPSSASTSSTQVPNIRSTDMPSLSKPHSSEHILLATYFDIGIIRTLFSPSWLTDGYIWCLEYLHKRMIDISDKILLLHHFKSLSISRLNNLNDENYYHEQITNNIIEKQYMMTTIFNSIKQQSRLLNIPFKYSSKKNLYKNISQKNSDYFFIQKRDKNKIRYIDEDRIEHLDLANDHFSLSLSKSTHLHLADPTLLLFKNLDTSNTLPISNLNTMKTYSISDSEINYKHLEEIPEAEGSSGYINRSGTINFSIILAGIHAVICKEYHLKVCELVMNILDILLGLNVISSTKDDAYKNQLLTNQRENEYIEQIDIKENEKFQLAVDIILRILKRLGCSNCQPRGRSFVADQLRGKICLSLNKLRLINEKRFEKCFLNFANNGELIHILDVLHALCSYCSKSSVGLAHYAPYLLTKSETHSRQTYSNNFDNTHLGIGAKCVDGFILNIIFKPLITRFHMMEEYLLNSENITLYSECRTFLIFVKENHGGIFRLAAFSSLIDPEKKLKIIKEKFAQSNDSRIRISPKHQSSDDIDGNFSQQFQPMTTEEGQSTMNARLKNQPTTGSLTEVDEHSLYANRNESLYVDLKLVRMGLLRLNFLMESCPPGSLPDPHFLNNLLFLDAPIISKAGFLIECAYFVHRCSLNQWPEWMRMNIITSRLYDTITGRTNGNINSKLNKIYQAAAARMFYIWGEALSSQLESILDSEQSTNDETFEDYYNEAIINRSGHDCPYSLQLIVCLLLYEITSFLRETYETLPKLSSLLTTGVNIRQQRTNNSQSVIDTGIDKRASDHLRMDSVVSQISNRSTASTTSEQPPPPPLSSHGLSTTIINMNPLVNERHISFAINTENDSNESNHTAIAMNDDDGGGGVTDGNTTTVPLATNITGKSKLNRRNSVKLRKPSVRMKDAGKNPYRSSLRTRRRSHASNISTDTDGHQNNIGNSILDQSDEYRNNTNDEFDIINTRTFPWIKIVIRIFNNINLTSDHQIKSCKNLLKALLNMYQLSSSLSYSRSSSIEVHLMGNKNQRFSTYLFGEQTNDLHNEKEINKHFNSISTYLEKQVGPLIQIPLMILCKSSVLLEDEHYSQILHLSWELLLDRNEELSSCAATIIILTAARAGYLIDKLISTEMENPSALIRYNAILKFEILWRFRYQFWIRLEENAHSMMKILPPSIEFVLPSPALGIANLQIVDPPWMPHAKTLVQQVALNQEEVRAVVTTSKTRKKHQQELIHSALMTEEISKQVARENFVMSSVSMLQAASFEPLLHQSRDEDEEAYVEDDRALETSVQLRQAQGTFPSAFGAAIFQLVEMLEDEETIDSGAIVSGAARKALWTCLLDEPTLLIRFFFEKLSHKERRIKSIQSLHRLMIYLTDIPSQFAHAIFNYVLGLLLSMVRSPLDGSQELIIAGLSLLWQIIPHLHGLVLKDFKQILRKEQAEMMILITGNIPSTKKVIIHGPDISQIPTQAIISEDTQFLNVLQEALEFFGIPDSKRDRYYLIDIKSQQIHIPDTYVRDFYFFRRNIYPQLSLVYMDTKQSQRKLEQISISIKTTELSKVLFARYFIESTPFNQMHNCITFFHDELLKSPLFPRKPLESDFNLYTKISDKELWNLDMLHKYNWIKLITCIFFNMGGKTTTTWDITLFLPIINGSFILHCEDLTMLRYCLATYINIVKHFRHIFATNGYLLIMPTFLRVYSNIQSNPILKKSIEYCCRQFFILHRIPFILQMLGSVSQLLDVDEQSDIIDTNKIQPISLFQLLIALEQTDIDAMRDDYSILELVKNDSITTKVINTPIVAALGQGTMIAPTTIKSLDFCYADDETIFTLLNCFDVCVTVVAYAPDSIRSLQMLGIIDILLPKYFEYLKDRTNKTDIQKHGRDELKIIEKLSIAMKTMINTSESLTRTFVEPKSDTLGGGHYKYSRGSYRSPSIAPEEDSTNRFIDDRTKSRAQDTDERKHASEFRWPRDTLLSIISTFIYFSTERFRELIKLLNDPTLRCPELLDAKSHTRLADIAHTLLKLGSFDPVTISCRGIQNYFQKLLPYTNWSQEQLRPALNLLLRRIDRMFLKICKKPITKRCFDWEATAGILNGIYLTIDRHPYIAYFPNLKTLVSGCIALILNENIIESNHSVPRLDTPTFPKEFSQAVIKLVGRYLLAIKYQPNLEALTSNNWSSTNIISTTNHLLHFLLPLMFWAGSGRKDTPKFHSIDISYIVTILLNSIKQPLKLAATMSIQSGQIVTTGKQYLTVTENILPNSNVTHKPMRQLKDLLQTASFLGLKILMIGFSKQLKREWQQIISAIKSICNKQSNISSNLLLFIDFIVSYKTPIYLILRPFLLHYMHSVTSENDYEMIVNIQQKLVFEKILPSKSTGEILHGLMQELNQLKAELIDESKTANSCDSRSIGTDKVRFNIEQIKDHDNRTSSSRLNSNQTTNFCSFRQQQRISNSSLNVTPNKRTEKIRGNESLNILESYYARYRVRCNDVDTSKKSTVIRPSSVIDEASTDTACCQSPTNSQQPMSLLRSAIVVADRSSSPTIHRSFQHHNSNTDNALNQSETNDKTEPKLRTFRGWKRNTVHLHRSRPNKSLWTSHISSEPSMTYDATQEMNNISRPVRQVNEQNSDLTNDLQSEK